MTVAYRFDSFELQPAQRRLLADGRPVTIGPRAFDLLNALIERRERLVSKDELLDVVWPGVVVEENNLQVQISALRKILGSGVVATVPGRGYRFVRPVDEAGAGGSTTARQPPVHAEPTPPTAPARSTNLPERLPPLYGRADDVAEIAAQLAIHRVVSIVGAGGIGKTRVARAVAGAMHDAYADGVWWVELAALSEGQLVAAEVARVLAAPLGTDRPAVETIAGFLRTQSLLLLLDNCEHLLEAVATLVDAVSQAAPDVRLLVTSQEPLRTSEEHVYRLNTLAFPSAPGIDAAQRSGAVQLFVGRAQAADPRFALTAENADAVVDICKRLDGIPLALELAAARLPLLGIDGLSARLDDRFRILTGGSRFVLRRHQTLRAALDFSHGLLSPAEQAVFRRIGVFAGSFSLENAQDVAADGEIDRWAVLDHLGALVDKSMVNAEGGINPRLRLLETTRAYALEKLADAGETPAMLERHARATAAMFARQYDEFWNLSDDAWLSRAEPELENLRAALGWALRNDAEIAIALVGDSRPLWLELALQPEALRHCEAALELVSAATPPRAAGRLWHALAAMCANTHPKRSRDAAAKAIELLRDADDPATLAAALMALAMGRPNTAPDQQQIAALDELRRLDNPRRPPRMRMLLPNASAQFHHNAGRYVEAARFHEMTRELAVACGATRWADSALENVGDGKLNMGDIDGAIAIFREAAIRLAASTDRLFYLYALGSLATALLLKSDLAAARDALARAAPLIVRFDLGARYAATAALLAANEGRWAAAAQLLGYGEAAAAAHGFDAGNPAEVAARAQVLQRLDRHLGIEEIAEWKRKGATLSVEGAYRLALGSATSAA